mgnify:CR=1 FL=1
MRSARLIWDMGKIAASGHPRKPSSCSARSCLRRRQFLRCFRPASSRSQRTARSMRKCTSTAARRARVFLLPTQILAKNVDSTLNVKPIRRSYIIRNGRVGPEWKAVKPRTPFHRRALDLDADQEPGHRRPLRSSMPSPSATAWTTTSSIFRATFPTRARRPSIRST